MTRTIIDMSEKFTKKDNINSRVCESMQDHVGETLKLRACACYTVEEDSGDIKQVSVFVLEDGTCLSSISPTVLDSMEAVIEILNTEGSCEISVMSRKSKGNSRDFLYINIL